MTADPLLAIQTKLKSDTTITALVSTRIYRDVLPNSPTLPAIVLTEISDISDDDSNTDCHAHVRIQTTVFSSGVASGEASSISKVIRKSLHNMVNTSLATSGDYVYVVSCQDAGASRDVNLDVSPKIWMMHRDFMIEYSY